MSFKGNRSWWMSYHNITCEWRPIIAFMLNANLLPQHIWKLKKELTRHAWVFVFRVKTQCTSFPLGQSVPDVSYTAWVCKCNFIIWKHRWSRKETNEWWVQHKWKDCFCFVVVCTLTPIPQIVCLWCLLGLISALHGPQCPSIHDD